MKYLYKNWITADLAVVILRVVLGVIFIAHGSQKVLGAFGGYGLEATVGYFSKNLGIPVILGYVALFTEFFGGIFILLGLFTRPAALGIFITMFVAFTVHLPAGFFLPNGFEYTFVLAFISLFILLFGAGNISLDNYLYQKLENNNK